MRGTVTLVNNSMSKPMLYFGVERKLMLTNAVICCLLMFSTHMQMPACFFGIAVFVIIHYLLKPLSQHDPMFADVLRCYTSYCKQDYFPSRSHPSKTRIWKVETVGRPA